MAPTELTRHGFSWSAQNPRYPERVLEGGTSRGVIHEGRAAPGVRTLLSPLRGSVRREIGMLGDACEHRRRSGARNLHPLSAVRGVGVSGYDRALSLTVAHNVVRPTWRRREVPAALALAAADPTRSFTDALIMWDLVSRLPYTDREVIVIHYALDWSLGDIGRVLHLTESAAKKWLHRARLRPAHYQFPARKRKA